jgi:hypothetical protein
MAFLGNLLAAGMSSGLIPNLLKGAGDVVGDIVGGLQRGEKLSPDLIVGALGRGAASTLGRVLAPKPQSEQAIRIMAPVGNSAANARPIMMPSSSGGDRVVMQAGGVAPLESLSNLDIAEYAIRHRDSGGYEGARAKRAVELLASMRLTPEAVLARNAKAEAKLAKIDAREAARERGEKPKKPKKFRNYYPKDADAPKRKR